MSDEQRYDLIARYLKGTMDESERTSFEFMLSEDASLQQELEFQRAALELLEHSYASDLSALLKEQLEQPLPKDNSKGRWYLGGIALLVAVVSAVYFLSSDSDNELSKTAEKLVEETTTESDNTLVQSDKVGQTSEQKSVEAITEKVRLQKQDSLPKEPKQKAVNPTLDSVGISAQIQAPTTAIQQSSTNQLVTEATSNDMQGLEPPKDPCAYTPNINVESKNSTLNEANGEIRLTHSYSKTQFALKGESFDFTNAFYGLEPGTYLIQMKDQNGCVFDLKKVVISEEPCTSQSDYSLNTSFGEELVLPLKGEVQAEIRIFNKLGKEVYTLSSADESSFRWKGYDNDRTVVAVGLHIVMVEYANGKKCKYNVVLSK